MKKKPQAKGPSLPEGYLPVQAGPGQFVTLKPGDQLEGILLGRERITLKGEETERWVMVVNGEVKVLPSFANLERSLEKIVSDYGVPAQVVIIRTPDRKAAVPGGKVATFLVGVKPESKQAQT